MGIEIIKKLIIAGVVFVFCAVTLGFFAAIGVWAAVSFLKLFGIQTL